MLASTSRASSSVNCVSWMTRARVFSNAAVHSKEPSLSAFVKPDIAKPTSFGQVMDRKAPFTKALNSLEKAVEAHDLIHALRVCVKVKSLGLKPTAQFYRMLMMLFEEKDMLREIVATFDDAVNIGVTPDREMWNYLLKARARDPLELFETVEAMRQAGHELNATSYRVIMKHHAEARNMLMCLRTLQEMKDAEVSPDILTVETLVTAACKEFLPRLGHAFAVDYEQKSARRLTLTTWTQILASSAHAYYTEGVVDAWNRVVVDGGITPDEGLCTMVINACGKAGLSALAEDAIAELQKLNVPLQEYHFSPLILALTHQAEIPAALDVFDLMEQHSIHPTRFTARALLKLLTSNPDHLQTALNHMRERVENGKVNLASAFNCILVATLKDRTNYILALGKDMDNLKVTPTIDTYNILIHSACLRRNVQAVHGYYDDILNRGLLPNKETYERIIVLLTSEPAYDDAFLYLHKMNAERIVPSFEVLMGLAKKCALRFDARWKSLVKMMEKNDYVVTDELMDFLVSNGRSTSGGGSQERLESSESFSGSEEVVEELDDSVGLPPNGRRIDFQ